MTPPTEAEVAAIAAKVPARYEALVWTLALGGLRIGEATGLRVRDVDLREGVIHVRASAPQIGGKKYLDQETKTPRSVRDVVIGPGLSRLLSEHLNTYSNRFDPASLVFTGSGGGAVAQGYFRERVFAPAARAAGIERRVRVHDLRHAAASLMAAHGFTMVETAAQLGHSVVSMTALYSHSFGERVAAKAALLDGALDSRRIPDASEGVGEG